MEQWIVSARNGDREAWEHIVRKYTGMALAVAYEKLRDFHLAEDAVQEALAEAFICLPNLQRLKRFPDGLKC